MRCIICDYSEDGPSLFHIGLHEATEGRRGFSETLEGPICSRCEEASEGLWEEPEEVGEETEEEDT